MTAEEYRQRMMQAFHNADCDELIAICVLPTEKEFEHLEWLLKNHYKKEPCGDAISRSEAIRVASGYCHWSNIPDELAKLPSVNTIPCEDAISRQEAIDAMATWDWQELYLPIHFKELLDELPPVSVKEKTGRWKKIKSGDKTFPESIVCSRCGWENSYISKWDRNNNPLSKTFKTTRYCPNCGAKMEVEE